MTAPSKVVEQEITTADTQLIQHSLDMPKVFAYPYGSYSKTAETLLSSKNYQLAFTTRPGTILCKKQRFSLPRVRIGNAPLSAYGF